MNKNIIRTSIEAYKRTREAAAGGSSPSIGYEYTDNQLEGNIQDRPNNRYAQDFSEGSTSRNDEGLPINSGGRLHTIQAYDDNGRTGTCIYRKDR